MRILLIVPNSPNSFKHAPKLDILLPPLGLEYIAAHIEDIAEIRLIDNRIVNLKFVEEEIRKFQPHYVGISFN